MTASWGPPALPSPTTTPAAPSAPARRGWRTVARLIPSLIVVLLIVATWPTRFGGSTTVLAVDGTSMQPTFHSGDLVVARTQDRYHVGDIIVFKVATTAGHNANIVHRIIAIEADGSFVTQGDNRSTADGFHTTRHDILGHVELRIPYGATTLRVLSRGWLLALLTGALVTTWIWPTAEKDDLQR